jgi:hypothetical protein
MTKITTADLHRRLEQAAREGGYKVEEWLKPGLNGQGMRVACTMFLGGQQHGLGFKWDGESMEDPARKCVALSYSMSKLPAMVAKGKSALWGERPQFMVQ